MIVLGIDPGTTRAGFSLIESQGSSCRLLASGLLSSESADRTDRLSYILNSLNALIEKYHPDRAAVEKLFFSKNKTTALEVAEARGVIMAVLGLNQIPTLELTPNEVKSFLVGHGQASKQEISRVINLILKQEIKALDDITDAIGLALLAVNLPSDK